MRGKWLKNLPPEVVSFEEVLLSNVYTQEALVNLLERKGVMAKPEWLEEIKKLRNRQNKIKVC